jgi:acyl carrier protein
MPTLLADEVLDLLQRSYDVVKPKVPHRLGRSDDIQEDLDLDSFDVIDLVSVLEDDLPPTVIDAVVERLPDMRTVGDVVDALVAATGEPAAAPPGA